MQTQTEMKEERPAFTPGPWHVSRGSRCYHVASADGTFETACIMFAGSTGDAAATARLIAAAPALYEACQAMRKSLDGSPSDFAGMLAAHRQLDAAVALAEGTTEASNAK